jgi:hypothetical protein
MVENVACASGKMFSPTCVANQPFVGRRAKREEEEEEGGEVEREKARARERERDKESPYRTRAFIMLP